MAINTKYIIVNISDVTNDMLEAGTVKNLDNSRKSLDETKCIMKWDGESTPTVFNSYQVYTHAQILQELSTNVWK